MSFVVPLIWPQVVSWWASVVLKVIKLWPSLWNEECFIKQLTSSIWWGFSSAEELKDIVMCVPWGGTRTLPQGCTIVSWLFLPCFCMPSLPWLATVWTCPLELREGHGGWSLFLTNKKWGTQKDFCAQEPHKVLLGFKTLSFSDKWRPRVNKTKYKAVNLSGKNIQLYGGCECRG